MEEQTTEVVQPKNHEAAMVTREVKDVSMITVDQARAENFLNGLQDAINLVQECHEIVETSITKIDSKVREVEKFEDETITLFNNLVSSATDLKQAIDTNHNYDAFLEEKLNSSNLRSQVTLLEQQLQKEKTELTLILKNIDDTVTKKLGVIEAKAVSLVSADTSIEKTLCDFKTSIEDIVRKNVSEQSKKTEEIIDKLNANATEETEDVRTAAETQFKGIKADLEKEIKRYTERCQDNFDAVQEKTLDYLEFCKKETSKLIEKVPAVAENKITKKDILLYAVAGASIVCNILFILM